MRVILSFFYSCILLFSVTTLHAQLRLPSFFSDNMVLQRDTVTKFWGWAKAGSKVKVKASWLSDTLEAVTTGEAAWSVALPTSKTGGPYTLTVLSGAQKLELKNLLMGEVWICSGQSNMQWNSTNDLKEMKDRLPNIANSKIRLLNVSNIASAFPQDDLRNSWQVCDPVSAETFSAIGYFFAEKLNQELDVPIGIINSSWGGTCAEVWTPEQVVLQDWTLKEASLLKKTAPRKPNLPGRAWNSMVRPIVGYAVAGVLWYQGEDNVVSWSSYEKLFSAMISAWREEWKDPFPFYFAQIAPYSYNNKDLPRAAYLREAQVHTALHHENVYMVPTSDLVPDVKNIHPTRKKEVAERFANIALAKNYGLQRAQVLAPIYKNHVIEGNKILIDFYHMAQDELVPPSGKQIPHLMIAGADKVFHQADFKIKGSQLQVFSKYVPKPVAVRYAFSETDLTDLKATNGLPVSLFRTDDWLQFTEAQ